MEITVEQQGHVTVIRPTGYVDAVTASAFAEALSSQLQGGHVYLVADLGQLEYMSSAGLRALLATLKDARRRGGDLRVANARSEVRQVLEMSGFTQVLQVFPSLAEAVSGFAEKSAS